MTDEQWITFEEACSTVEVRWPGVAHTEEFLLAAVRVGSIRLLVEEYLCPIRFEELEYRLAGPPDRLNGPRVLALRNESWPISPQPSLNFRELVRYCEKLFVKQGGRSAEYQWAEMDREVERMRKTARGLPKTKAQLVRDLEDWCQSAWGTSPDESSIKRRIDKFYR